MAAAAPALNSELVDALKRLRLGPIAASLPERLVPLTSRNCRSTSALSGS